MSPPDKTDLARGWRWVERLIAEDAGKPQPAAPAAKVDLARGMRWLADKDEDGLLLEKIARVEAQSRAETILSLSDAGVPLSKVPSARQLLRRTKARSLRAAWYERPLSVGLAVVALGLVVLAVVKRDEVVAFFEGEHIGPDDQRMPRKPAPLEVARALRDDAFAECGRWSWDACEKKLDEAARLDPAGDSEPRVQQARQAIAAQVLILPDGGPK